jgi:hypothetical protein
VERKESEVGRGNRKDEGGKREGKRKKVKGREEERKR